MKKLVSLLRESSAKPELRERDWNLLKLQISFHDCGHYFIGVCVMSGIDFMTIAKWVGHQNGGILIGKVYGHLSNEHAKRQAEKIRF